MIAIGWNGETARAESNPEFFPCLESLRSVCAIIVALYHVGWTSHLRLIPAMDRAWTFVDFFFVLSGFVIANAYFDRLRTRAHAAQFMIKRLMRLYPLHLVTLVAVGGMQLAGWQLLGRAFPFGESWPVLLPLNLLLSHGIGLADGAILNVPSWSISVELYAYMTFCMICLCAPSPRWRTGIIGAIMLSSLLVLLTMQGSYGLSTPANNSLARGLMGFGIGCLLMTLRRKLVVRIQGFTADVTIIAIAAVIAAMMSIFDDSASALIALPPLFALLILALVSACGSRVVSALEAPLFRSFGLISYSIYMNHVAILIPFSFLAGRLAIGHDVGTLTAVPLPIGDLLAIGYIAVVLASAWVSYRWIEQPGREWGRRMAARLGTRADR